MQGYLVINPRQLTIFLVKRGCKTKGMAAKMQHVQRWEDFVSSWSQGQVVEQSKTQQDVRCMPAVSPINPAQINLFSLLFSLVSKQPTLQATQVATHVPKLQLDYAIQSLVRALVHTLTHPSLMSGHYQNIRLYWFCNTGQISGGVGCDAGHKLLTCPRDGRTKKGGESKRRKSCTIVTRVSPAFPFLSQCLLLTNGPCTLITEPKAEVMCGQQIRSNWKGCKSITYWSGIIRSALITFIYSGAVKLQQQSPEPCRP